MAPALSEQWRQKSKLITTALGDGHSGEGWGSTERPGVVAGGRLFVMVGSENSAGYGGRAGQWGMLGDGGDIPRSQMPKA